MHNILYKKKLVEAETEKIKEKRKATIQKKTHEEKIIIAIGRYTMGVIAVFFTGLAICLAIWRTL